MSESKQARAMAVVSRLADPLTEALHRWPDLAFFETRQAVIVSYTRGEQIIGLRCTIEETDFDPRRAKELLACALLIRDEMAK